jgi:hypothetical protein
MYAVMDILTNISRLHGRLRQNDLNRYKNISLTAAANGLQPILQLSVVNGIITTEFITSSNISHVNGNTDSCRTELCKYPLGTHTS